MTAEDDDSLQDTGGEEGGNDRGRKRKERLEQNRISARESRKRKKTMIEELQRTVITLSRENKELNERNEQLRRQLVDIGSKYPNVVPLQAIVGQATQTASTSSIDGGDAGSIATPNPVTTESAPDASENTKKTDD
uniref:BZIP domain-containing protein n=1 Tax=Entomoneis paludosa TaxID=265537 RepID=A0A7S2VBD2_9STRA|mmetsp:Transcript_14633/g.30219  ORF Transcript_14633/g.30219 Transcript_14633/m.30219 type:complete len:136 (+) Transcript_14633:145-552(+)|eukprot:CAMPEP_0172457170 /NCGR_PEP_ID=MMETSP1065-20121228/20536_1 /TAXON_ID=265537 /ORGANISM="Amphiprora paludosa, Strain CCMP125" /LENGTH=135 /DNA_ID=CAMNT_0013210731 /DNA_START=47 /DNA_END=454 /DNA_ORIENTATION=+